MKFYATNRDRTSDLKIFSLTLSQLSYRGTLALSALAIEPKILLLDFDLLMDFQFPIHIASGYIK